MEANFTFDLSTNDIDSVLTLTFDLLLGQILSVFLKIPFFLKGQSYQADNLNNKHSKTENFHTLDSNIL